MFLRVADPSNNHFGPHGVCTDIEEWLAGAPKIPAADIVVGGPPCQGFSLLNKKRHGDARRALWEPFMDVVEHSGARAFVIENVQGLKDSPEHSAIEKRAKQLGFETAANILNTANYGAPQTRKRTIIVGWKPEGIELDVVFPPEPTHCKGGCEDLPAWKTVADVIKDLPPPSGTEVGKCGPPLDLHFGRNPTRISRQRYRMVPKGGNRFDLQKKAPDITPKCWIRKKSGGTDLFGRLWWDRPSVTIRTEFFKPEKGRYLHPEQHRPITHREAARLMGFPDDFVFLGTKIEIARQIGNAVPPDLAGAIAKTMARLFTKRRRRAA